MDLSDGLGRDSDRIAKASGVLIEIDASKLPINHRCTDWRQAVSEGEDYELIMCIDPNGEPPKTNPLLIGPVGTVRACARGQSPAASIIDPHGNSHSGQDLGWDH
jgi:thiamine monophosphate kinase